MQWEHHPSHSRLVVLAAATTAALAYATGDAAERRGDTRLLLGLALLPRGRRLPGAARAGRRRASSWRHSNLGFQIAVPVGLMVASAFAAASALAPAQRHRPERTRLRIRAALIVLMIGWGIATVAGLAPLDRVTEVERASGPITVLAVAGAVCSRSRPSASCARARRRSLLPLAVATRYFLLAEAILATAFARNWHASWWEWHLLILAGFAVVAWAARREWREERFASLYTEETAASEREMTVLFADLAGFTAFSEGRDPA